MHHERTKHIDVRYHFIREIVAKKTINLAKLSTRENAACMFTKSLPTIKFKHCLDLLRIKAKEVDNESSDCIGVL